MAPASTSRARRSAPCFRGSMPRMRSAPPVIGDVQPIIRIVEVLPAPLRPITRRRSPFSRAKSTSVVPAD